MKLLEFKNELSKVKELRFQLPDGSWVPEHFHVTEVGAVNKHFIDCGGTERKENVISFQLWNANDYNHRLHPEKLQHIIELSQTQLQLENNHIEVEYQGQTIQKFGVEFTGSYFKLAALHTDCLAKDNCGVPSQKPKVKLDVLQEEPVGCCNPASGCC